MGARGYYAVDCSEASRYGAYDAHFDAIGEPFVDFVVTGYCSQGIVFMLCQVPCKVHFSPLSSLVGCRSQDKAVVNGLRGRCGGVHLESPL